MGVVIYRRLTVGMVIALIAVGVLAGVARHFLEAKWERHPGASSPPTG